MARAKITPKGILPAAIALAALALALAGCGGATDPGVAKLGTTATSDVSTAAGGASPAGGPSESSSADGHGSESEGVMAAPAGAAAQQKMVAFARCMRTHGAPDFPEPVEGKIIIRGRPGSGLNPQSPQFQAAQRACQSLAPHPNVSPQQSAEAQAKALKFSECMRSHGLPKFPDPKFSGDGIQLSINPSMGINPNSPQFQAAQKACQGDMPKGGPPPATASGGGAEGEP